jgi:hypothetical protein
MPKKIIQKLYIDLITGSKTACMINFSTKKNNIFREIIVDNYIKTKSLLELAYLIIIFIGKL